MVKLWLSNLSSTTRQNRVSQPVVDAWLRELGFNLGSEANGALTVRTCFSILLFFGQKRVYF